MEPVSYIKKYSKERKKPNYECGSEKRDPGVRIIGELFKDN